VALGRGTSDVSLGLERGNQAHRDGRAWHAACEGAARTASLFRRYRDGDPRELRRLSSYRAEAALNTWAAHLFPLRRVNTKYVDDQGEVDEGGEDEVELFEAGEDAAEALEPAEQALDLVAPAIEAAVVGPGVAAAGVGRHDGREAELQHQLPGLVAFIRRSITMGTPAGRRCQPISSLRPSGASWACPGDRAKVRAVRSSAATR
jgi:hypothetical protein